MLAGMIARPRATSERTNSGSKPSRIAMNSISGVTIALARVVQLRDGAACLERGAHARGQRGRHRPPLVRDGRYDRATSLTPPRRVDPLAPQLRQALADVVPLRTARVVHAQRRLAAAERDLAHRHAHAAPVDVDLAGVRERGREVDG